MYFKYWNVTLVLHCDTKTLTMLNLLGISRVQVTQDKYYVLTHLFIGVHIKDPCYFVLFGGRACYVPQCDKPRRIWWVVCPWRVDGPYDNALDFLELNPLMNMYKGVCLTSYTNSTFTLISPTFFLPFSHPCSWVRTKVDWG